MIKILQELKECLLEMRSDDKKRLEESILEEGCRDALVIWNDILVDGHNRYEICQKHEIPFNTIQKEFTDIEGAKQWMYRNQLGRRNLTDKQRDIIIGRLYKAEKKSPIENLKQNLPSGHCVHSVKTSEIISENYNVSEKTARRAEKFTEAVDVLSKTIEKPVINKMLNDEIPVSKKDMQRIADFEPEKQKAIINKLVSGEAKSYTDARRLIKKDEVYETHEIKGKYRIIYADPPWCYGDKLTDGYGTAENHYPTMTIKELCELPIKELAEDDAVLFLWATSPLLEECFPVINLWGFKYKTSFVWDKVKHNMGHYNSVRHELLLICTRGSCLPDGKTLYDSVVSIERSDRHSEKPEEFRHIIDSLYTHGNRIELFSRKKVDGWASWGNEVDSP